MDRVKPLVERAGISKENPVRVRRVLQDRSVQVVGTDGQEHVLKPEEYEGGMDRPPMLLG